jgi:hypothetical protein
VCSFIGSECITILFISIRCPLFSSLAGCSRVLATLPCCCCSYSTRSITAPPITISTLTSHRFVFLIIICLSKALPLCPAVYSSMIYVSTILTYTHFHFFEFVFAVIIAQHLFSHACF